MNLEELKKAVRFAAEVTNRFSALDAAQDEVTPEDVWKGTNTILLDVARETIGCVNYKKNLIVTTIIGKYSFGSRVVRP